jgi:translation initiation factor 1 (eIF-1/SUI1)
VSRKTKDRVNQNIADISIDGGGLSVSIGDALRVHAENDSADAGAEVSQPDVGVSERKPDLTEFIRRTSQITMHRESAGRRGHTVTAAAFKPEPDIKTLEAAAKTLRKGLGCGSHIEGSRVILHGDVMDRAESWFAKNGAKKIVRGN